MLYSQSSSKSTQSKSKSKFFIKKAKQPYVVWNIKKLGDTIGFKVHCAICKEAGTAWEEDCKFC